MSSTQSITDFCQEQKKSEKTENLLHFFGFTFPCNRNLTN